jgi:hypothetical protein
VEQNQGREAEAVAELIASLRGKVAAASRSPRS